MGEHGDESQSKSALPQSSYLKKRQLCFTSGLPNTQHWPPAYAQQQQTWLIAHLSTVHASSCNATEPAAPSNTWARPLQGCGHPRLLSTFTVGTNPRDSSAETAVSALPGENQTANITCLVFLAAAERRLQDPARSCKSNRTGWGKKSIFTLNHEPCLAGLVQITMSKARGELVCFCY